MKRIVSLQKKTIVLSVSMVPLCTFQRRFFPCQQDKMNVYLRRLKERKEEINAMDRKDYVGRKDSAGAWQNPIRNSGLTTKKRKQMTT